MKLINFNVCPFEDLPGPLYLKLVLENKFAATHEVTHYALKYELLLHLNF